MPDNTVVRLARLAKTGLALLTSGVALLALLLLFEPFLRRQDVVNREVVGWVALVCIALAAVLGGLSWRSKLGRAVFIVGCILTIGLLLWVATPIP
jgi:hypothetical protein